MPPYSKPTHPRSIFENLGAQVEEMSVSDSFVVDIEGFSHLTETEINANSRVYSNHSKKGVIKGGGGKKKINSTAANQRTAAALEASTTATLHGGRASEKSVVAALGATDHATNPKIHHQISIKKGSLNSPPPESRQGVRRFRHRHSPSAWSIDPKKILMLFAILSSFGTVLLIYFTLSMSKLNGDDDGIN
ncbi:hypothetical protein C2S51_015851 [Perilla frutescens var. frutescens]|nr:hypothetical protein C2S51_015851 [Perilla frutescens var. frutescens]